MISIKDYIESKHISLNAFLSSILTLFIVFASICPIHAQEISLNGGLGFFTIEGNTGQVRNNSRLNRRDIGLDFRLEKDDYPLIFSLKSAFFSTNTKQSGWYSPNDELLQENTLDAQGLYMDMSVYYTFYTYAPKNSPFLLKPFLGGGLVYRRIKLDRDGLKGEMIPIGADDISFYFREQRILAIGGMPQVGLFFRIPKRGIDMELAFGWGFLSVNSTIDYGVSIPVCEERLFKIRSDTSASSMLGRIRITKTWDDFTVGLGYEWEYIKIDDKSTPFIFDYNVPFPEFRIKQGVGQIFFGYLF